MAAGFFAAFFAAGFFAAFLAAGFLAAAFFFAGAFFATFFAAFLAAGFFAAAFLAAGFLAATFLAGAFFAGAFFAGAFLAATFFAGAFLAGAFFAAAFFAGAFLAATFFAGAFFGAAFLAAGFFAVAIVFSLITLQRALHVWSTRSDSRRWAVGEPGPAPRTREQSPTRTLRWRRWSLQVWKSLLYLVPVNPTREHHRTGTRSHGFQKSCVLFSGQSFRSSTETGFPRSGTAFPDQSAWPGGWQYNGGSL